MSSPVNTTIFTNLPIHTRKLKEDINHGNYKEAVLRCDAMKREIDFLMGSLEWRIDNG